MSEHLKFMEAIEKMKEGAHVTRIDWGDSDVYCLFVGDILHIHKSDGTLHQLVLRIVDFEANDWAEVD